MAPDTPRIAANITDFIRARGGPYIGAILSASGCFECSTLDGLWDEDADGWEAFFSAWQAVSRLQDTLMRRDLHSYSVPSETMFSTLKMVTMIMSETLAQSVLLESQGLARKLLHQSIGNQVINLLEQPTYDSRILVQFLAEVSIALKDTADVARALESIADMSPSKHEVLDAIRTHATGRMLGITKVESEVMA